MDLCMVDCVLPYWRLWYVEEQSRDDLENHCYFAVRRTNHHGNFEYIDGIDCWLLVLPYNPHCKSVDDFLIITNGFYYCGTRREFAIIIDLFI